MATSTQRRCLLSSLTEARSHGLHHAAQRGARNLHAQRVKLQRAWLRPEAMGRTTQHSVARATCTHRGSSSKQMSEREHVVRV
eukprot:1153133-Pelagomonas_calceolata.AAC.9